MTDIEIIAEILNAHQGSLELALELAPLAVSVGKAAQLNFRYFGEKEVIHSDQYRPSAFRRSGIFCRVDW